MVDSGSTEGIRPYDPARYRRGVREVLEANGWEERYVAGQLAGLDALSAGPQPGTRGAVFVSDSGGRLRGFVSVEYREWNRLGQLHGLAVDPGSKRRGGASALVRSAEGFVRAQRTKKPLTKSHPREVISSTMPALCRPGSTWVRERLGELTGELAKELTDEPAQPAPVEGADALADGWALLLEGVYASAQAPGGVGSAGRARDLAEALLAAPDQRL